MFTAFMSCKQLTILSLNKTLTCSLWLKKSSPRANCITSLIFFLWLLLLSLLLLPLLLLLLLLLFILNSLFGVAIDKDSPYDDDEDTNLNALLPINDNIFFQ